MTSLEVSHACPRPIPSWVGGVVWLVALAVGVWMGLPSPPLPNPTRPEPLIPPSPPWECSDELDRWQRMEQLCESFFATPAVCVFYHRKSVVAARPLPLPLPRTSCPCALPRALAAKSGQDQIRIAKLSLPPVTTQPAAPNPGYASTIRSPKPEASADTNMGRIPKPDVFAGTNMGRIPKPDVFADTNMGRIPKPDVFAGTNMGRIPKPDAFTGTDTDRLPIPERLTLPVDNPVPVPACACAQEPSLKVEAQFQVAIRGSQAPVLTPAADDVLACQSLLPSAHQCLDRPDFLATTKESPSLAECTFAPLDCRPLCFVFGT